MAEILAGEHCSAEFCKQLDFLPFSCDGCGKIFCLEHRSKDAHSCSKCLVDDSLPEYSGPKSFKCSLSECQGRELMEVICEHCQQNFCLSHRHRVDHRCEKLDTSEPEMSKTAKHVQQILESKQTQPRKMKPRSHKSSKTAAKVALMKLKLRSTGEKGIPETEKTYFDVVLPLCHNERRKAMYFSKKWSIGRVIDNIADVCELKNENNTGALKKLRLFTADAGTILSTEKSVESYVDKEELFSGSTVVLEYVSGDVNGLDNIDAYVS